ncbi:class I SAM-dependent methyltransferase [Motilimonas eburnea]|uniref:class I SAM-dependent methyltransferase n=1 Tax=Motilimonas eburnea TaxID=1737488 RepID=UPI001E5C91E3|nr:class I SAM-dependent methyltransferase [Motilimonas eburnea]MCE2571947.1 class I SAM-dependent methyltransferase [Motilimonas eburnea]
MKTTNQYYNDNAQSFFTTTVNVDVQKLYDRFLPRVDNHGKILDAGCGSGRDSKNFISLGYKVVAFDASESLVAMASEYIGQQVIQATFSTFKSAPADFDAIWACASLLHVAKRDLKKTFLHLSDHLKTNGIFYCSFKYGNTEQVRNGRFFVDMNEQNLKDTLLSTQLEIEETWISSDARPGREAEQWLNAILVKKD